MWSCVKRRKAEPGGTSELTVNDLQVQLAACFPSVLQITPVIFWERPGDVYCSACTYGHLRGGAIASSAKNVNSPDPLIA